MKDYDLIISPVTPTTARTHGTTYSNIRDDIGYLVCHNLTGWPATVVPCGFSKNRMPIGIQIVAKPWHDHYSLAVAMRIQKILGVYDIPEISLQSI